MNQTPLWNKIRACRLAAKAKPCLKKTVCLQIWPQHILAAFGKRFACKWTATHPKAFFKHINLLIKVLWPTFFDEGAFVLLFFCVPVGAIAGVVAAWCAKRLLRLWHGICLQVCRKRTNNLFFTKGRVWKLIANAPTTLLKQTWLQIGSKRTKTKKFVYKLAVKNKDPFEKGVCLRSGRKRAKRLFEKMFAFYVTAKEPNKHF